MFNYEGLPRWMIILGIIFDSIFIIFFFSLTIMDFNAGHRYLAIFEGIITIVAVLDLYCLSSLQRIEERYKEDIDDYL